MKRGNTLMMSEPFKELTKPIDDRSVPDFGEAMDKIRLGRLVVLF
jgi:hypothetical protein